MARKAKSLSEAEVRKVLSRKTEAELLELQYTWGGFYARPNQLAPGPERLPAHGVSA